VRFFGDILTGFAIAKFGPKHVWIFSHSANILNLLCLLWISKYPWLIGLSVIFNALGSSFQYIPIHVDFSKIKHLEHNGKEQGYFLMLEKVGSAIGPLLGGYIAAEYGASYAIIASIVLYVGSLIPLMASPEPVLAKQKITFKGFPFKKVWRDIVANAARAVDATVSTSMWPIFMALTFFHISVYEEIGFVTTISFVLAVIMTYGIGKFIDKYDALKFLRVGTFANSLVHLGRVFTSNLFTATGINIANEATTVSTSIAYYKGVYDAADDLPGFRIIYFVVIEAAGELVKIPIWLLLFGLTFATNSTTALQVCFVVTAIVSLGLLLENFKALRPNFLARLLQ
jgi:MFS family permease